MPTVAKLFKEDWEVNSRLDDFNTTKDELLDVVRESVAARNEFVPNDPINAGGMLAYIYGTRRLRDVFLPKGWERNRSNNIESVYDPVSGVKIVYQNADGAADPLNEPRAISKKGPAAARAVDQGQLFLFPDIEEQERREENALIWYLFVHIDGDDVRAELSCPKSIEDEQFKGFNERIFLLRPGDWTDFSVSDDGDPGEQDFEINVTRKEL